MKRIIGLFLALFAFAGIGFVAGQIAELVVGESVQARFQDELAARDATSKEKLGKQTRR